jgi:glycine/D-amino acid oxidase-like deaminating enzyme
MLRELGSYYLAYDKDAADMREEFDTLVALGCDDIEWCDKATLLQVEGCSRDFHCGIYFPDDAVIDSSAYARGLLAAAAATGAVKLCQGVQVASTRTVGESAVVTLTGGATITANHCVVATGGLTTHPELSGILTPEYSYLVHVPPPQGFTAHPTACANSANFFTLWFSHDW